MQLSNPRTRPGGMTPNGPRVREALLCVIAEADKIGARPTQFEVLKSIFLGDRAHLNRYGRPITYDAYVAMKDGPVPSLAYNILKGSASALGEARIKAPLWKVNPIDGGKIQFYGAVRAPSEDVLSESDIEELTKAFAFVRQPGVTKIWEFVHKDAAYKDAWAKRQGDEWQHPMELALLFETPNHDVAEALKFFAANQ